MINRHAKRLICGFMTLLLLPLECSSLDFGKHLRRSIASAINDESVETFASTTPLQEQAAAVTLHPLKDPTRKHRILQQEQSTDVDQSRRTELSRDRESLIHILMSAGVTYLSLQEIGSLPTWTQVSSLYGSEPLIYGLETCQAYRDTLQRHNATAASAASGAAVVEPKPRVAGLFNTGTNALAQSMFDNFQPLPDVKDYNLKWGKHVPPRDRWTETYKLETIETELPIVMVRDPMYWMQSMCKAEYNAVWDKGLGQRCPNLIPTAEEREALDLGNATTFPVDVIVRTHYRDHYESLAGLWSEWNRLWLDYSRPRLMIRFEDFLFHGEYIMQTISECTGISMHQDFRYQLEASKPHGQSSDLYGALVKYGSGRHRIANYTVAEHDYLTTALDPELMRLFQYQPLDVAETYAGM
ncbi:hypothetical protein MPSEU_001076400 [Mayamaea pseudoterrestris]|nr:hypothetical protein MPSEU_001076400 [Mayamaea pseudoterrestris]